MTLLPYKQSPHPPEQDSTGFSAGLAAEPTRLGFEGLQHPASGRLAQPVAASALHAEGRGFEPLTAHQIPLTQGYSALVDLEDFEKYGHLKWTAAVQKKNGTVKRVYAYRSVWIDGKCHTIFLHRLIANAQPGEKIDHWDRQTLNCRRYNLRPATSSQNACNRVSAPSKHGFVGVDSQTDGRFRGRVCSNGRAHYTQTFSSPVLAAIARDQLARKLHGKFAVLSFTPLPAQAHV